MTYSHDETNARLLDLVYGEAAPSERVALEAHVAGCARCQAEVAALGGTRAVVRAALVDQAAPKGVHARLMQAATEAVTPVPRAAAAAAVVAPAPRPRVAAPTETPSFWGKLRRGWTLPTFATVGAFAVLLLASKVFLSPRSTYERGQQGLIPAEPAPAASVRDVENAPVAAPSPEDKAAPEARADEPAREALRRQVGLAREHAVAASLGKSMRHEHGADGVSDVFDGLSGKEAFGGGETRGPHGGTVPGLGTLRGVSASGGGRGVGSVSGNVVGGAASKAPAPKPSSRSAAAADDFAAPPAGWAKGGASAAEPASPAPPPAAAPVAARKNVVDDLDRAAPTAKTDRREREASLDEGAAAPSRVKAEKASALDAPPAEKKKAAAPTASKAVTAASSAPAAQAPAKDVLAKSASDTKESDAASAQETLARRAEQLFVQRRWDESVAAYRELIRRFPTAEPAAKWRTRLAQAERESAQVTASRAAKAAPKAVTKKAAKAVSDAPTEGL